MRWIQINSFLGQYMRRIIAFAVFFMMLALPLPSSNALPAEPTNAGPVFGGQHVTIDNITTNTSLISDLPAIAEDFTATWCDNCIKAEAELNKLEAEGLVQKYEFHRSPDYEDPLGDDFASSYLTERYGVSLPPLVAFNGIIMKHGTLPDSDSLENDYRTMLTTPINLEDVSSFFSWTPKALCDCEIANNSGIISWDLDINMSSYPNAVLNVNAWFVEQSAEYPDGGNGAGTYHDIVRNITELGNEKSGTATIQIPAANDGNDLEVHLVYVMTFVEPSPEPTKTEDSVPGFGVVITLTAVLGAIAITGRR